MTAQLTLFDYAALDAETRIVVQQRTTEIKALMKRAASDIVEMGNKFDDVRSRLRHNKSGGFEGWYKSEGFGRDFVYRCLAVFERFGNLPNIGELGIPPTVLAFLAAPATPESAREEALIRAEEGELITHSLARGIIHDHKHPAESYIPDGDDLTPYERQIAAHYADGFEPQHGNLPIEDDETARLDDGYTSQMKPKINRAGDIYEPRGFDSCQTPPEAIDPLLPYLPMDYLIWEPACGEGTLVEAFYDADRQVIGTDIITGANFFTCDGPDNWSCIVTNPPYSIKYDWLERCYAIGKPFALLLPVETLGAQRAQRLFAEHGVEIILLNRRINFKMPNIGWDGSAAQFPVAWFTWRLDLEAQIVFGRLP